MVGIGLTLTLVAIVFPVLAAILGALLLLTGAWGAWEQIPEDVRCEHRKWRGPLGPVNVWFYAWACPMVGDLMPEDMALSFVFSILAGIVLFLGGCLHLTWALRILRDKADVPASLLRFARYAAGLSVAGLVIAAALFCKGARLF